VCRGERSPWLEGSCVCQAMRKNTRTFGRNPRAVRPADSFTKKALEAQIFHLKTTFEAHQKLATLSSNKPRPNGKMRLIGSRMADRGANGGRNGRKSTRNDREVTKARRKNNLPLPILMSPAKWEVTRSRTHWLILDIGTLREDNLRLQGHNITPFA
jgi:hypothetical protein